MIPGECNFAHRHDASARTSGGGTATKSWSTENASGNDPAVYDTDPSWDRITKAIPDHLYASDSPIRSNHWIIEVDHHYAIVSDAIGEKSLHAAIRANGAVSIKVIDGHVRKHANVNRRVE